MPGPIVCSLHSATGLIGWSPGVQEQAPKSKPTPSQLLGFEDEDDDELEQAEALTNSATSATNLIPSSWASPRRHVNDRRLTEEWYAPPVTLPPPPFYRFRPPPWHGLGTGDDAPRVVNAYIEITPFDTMKYEIDKPTGYLRLDRPQRGSAQPPT